MVVVDHDQRQLVWAAPGRNSATVGEFFDLLGEERCAQITHVSADGADFIDTIVAQRCPNAVRVADPFHVVKWATEALDEVRREAWNDARKQARNEPRRGRGRPRADAPPRPGSERAKSLKGARYSLWKNPEDLTENQQTKLKWIAESIVKHRERIPAAIEHHLSNGLIESANTKIRLLTRIAFGFHSAQALIAMAMLTLGGHRPTLPGRN